MMKKINLIFGLVILILGLYFLGKEAYSQSLLYFAADMAIGLIFAAYFFVNYPSYQKYQKLKEKKIKQSARIQPIIYLAAAIILAKLVEKGIIDKEWIQLLYSAGFICLIAVFPAVLRAVYYELKK